MIPIDGKPFLEHQINLLKRASVHDFVICVGYKGEVIKNYFDDGRSLKVRIRYSDDGPTLLGTAGSIKNANSLLSDRFFITFGDAYPVLDYGAAWMHFLSTGMSAMMTVYKNANKYGKSNTSILDGRVTYYSKNERVLGMEYIEFGVTFMNRHVLTMIPPDYPVDLELLYKHIISKNQMAALEVKQRIYDIGSPEGLSEFRQLVSSGRIHL